MVKNEQDIVEPFIRHNARFVDAMIILDNASVDETRRIAMNCARELGNVIVTDNEEFGYAQAERMTRVLNGCQSAFFADFVMFLDADEFISAPDRGALTRILARIEPGGIGLMPWWNFVLTPDEAAAETRDPPRRMRHRRTADARVFYKAVLRADGVHRADLFVAQGNHDILTIAGNSLPTVLLGDLPLLHFPIRSREQMTTKTIVGWVAYVGTDPGARRAPDGLQWRDAFDRIVAGGISPAELADLSLRYGQPPMALDWDADVVESDPPSDYVRKYGPGTSADPLAVIARSWERSLSGPPAPFAAEGAALPDGCFLDVAPFRFIVEKYAPATVLEIGCGAGANLALFKRLGAGGVVGLDAAPREAVALADDEYVALDKWQAFDLGRVFDLVVCTALAEDRGIADVDVLIDSIVRHVGETIVLAASGGDGDHQANAAWITRLAARGWHPALMDSLGARALASLPWLRRSLIVLRRGDARIGADAAAALAALDAKDVRFPAAQVGVFHHAFQAVTVPA
jgi:SAM-dependent methyltransferase